MKIFSQTRETKYLDNVFMKTTAYIEWFQIEFNTEMECCHVSLEFGI